jgi:hypothetical protein
MLISANAQSTCVCASSLENFGMLTMEANLRSRKIFSSFLWSIKSKIFYQYFPPKDYIKTNISFFKFANKQESQIKVILSPCFPTLSDVVRLAPHRYQCCGSGKSG